MPLRPLGPDHEALVALHADGVTLLVDAGRGRLPAVVHWGAAVPDLDEPLARTLRLAAEPLIGPNEVDVPVRLSVIPEPSTGWAGTPGLQGSREGAAWSTRFTTTSVALDGSPVEGFASGGPGELVVGAVDEEAGLSLEIVLALLPSGLVRGRASVTNLRGPAYSLHSLVIALPVPAEAGELLDFTGRWGRERAPQRLPFRAGTHLRENRRGRTGLDSAFVLHAGTPGFGNAEGEVYAVHTAYSGNHVHYAERVFHGHRVLGGGEVLLPGEVALDEGETYTSPWLYGSYGHGLDEVAGRFHAHLRSRPRAVGPRRPVTFNVWEAVEFDHDLDRLRALAEDAAKAGVERFVLDDGWFGARRHDRAGLGDWEVSETAWPAGLHPLVDHVRPLGMEFGLWVEPEMVSPDSDVARAHPDWVLSARREWPVEARHQQVLNLAIPEAYAHVRSQLLALLAEYDIGYLKWDHNRDLVEAGDQHEGGRAGVHAQTHATYRLLDELRAAHPDLEIESCSSGGGRVDLEILERTDRVWVSDCIDPLERQRMLRWTGQLVPPEMLGSHIASARSRTTGRTHDLSFRAGTAIFGHLGVEWDLAAASSAEREGLRRWIELYAEHRQLLMSGRVIRMDGAHDGHDDAVVHGVAAQDRSEAIFALAVLGMPADSPGPRLRFRGLDPAARYRLRPLLVGDRPAGLAAPAWWGDEPDLPGCEITGAALEHVGVAPPVVHPEQVVLFHAHRLPERPLA